MKVYTVRIAPDEEAVPGKYKMYKGDHRSEYPDQRAFRVARIPETLVNIARDNDADRVHVEQENLDGEGLGTFETVDI